MNINGDVATMDRIAKLQAEIDRLKAEQDRAAALLSLGQGDKVTIDYGKGTTRRTVAGTVYFSDPDTQQAVIITGDGLNSAMLTTRFDRIIAINGTSVA